MKEAKTDNGVAGAIIVLKSKEGKNLSFSTSNSSGNFSIKLKKAIQAGDSLHVTILGYKSLVLAPKIGSAMTISPEIDAITLKETIVKAPKVSLRGDTVKYNVKSFAEVQDKNIGDVLKKLPGINVSKAGQITYNGKPINNFYIEGNDMLGGRYGIATKNISAKDVQSVEVLENHQPTKVLKDLISSENAAINLRLTEEAKAKWIWRGEAAAGYGEKLILDADLFNMRIAKGGQSISSAKVNNTGKNYAGENNVYFMDAQSKEYDLEDYISVGVSNAPLAQERVRFNNSAYFSTTNSWILKKDYSLKAQATYLFDHLESANRSQTSYFFPDSTKVVNESDKSYSRKHQASCDISLKANKDNYYLIDKLCISSQWRDASSLMTGSFPNRETASTPELNIHNSLQYIKKMGNNTFDITTNNQFINKNHSLLVERMDGSDKTQHQDINTSAFFTNTATSYNYRSLNGLIIAVKGSFEAVLKNMESSLSGIDTPGTELENPISFTNDLYSGYLRPNLKPSLSYENSKLKVSLSAPISYEHFWGLDKESGDHLILDDSFNISGNLNFRWKIHSKFETYLGGNIARGKLNLGDIFEGNILRNYRQMSFGNLNTEKDLSTHTFLRLSFRDPVNSFFLNGEVSWSHNKLKNIASQYFLGDYIISGLIPQLNNISSWNAELSGSKGIYAINGKIDISGSYNRSTMESLQDGILSPYLSEGYKANLSFNGRFAKWFLMEYAMDYSHSILTLNPQEASPEDKNHKNYFDHNMSLIFKPIENLSLSIAGEHYFTELSETQNKNMFLVDIIAEYYLKNSIRLSISAKNILNTKVYSYSLFSGLSSFSAAYDIRPLNILCGVYISF